MKLTGPNPPALFLTLCCSSFKTPHPSTGPQPPLPFSIIIPFWRGHCQSKIPQGNEGRMRRVRAHNTSVSPRMCLCLHTASARVKIWHGCVCRPLVRYVPVHTREGPGCFKVGVRRGISSEGRRLLQTIWAVKVEALGLDLDLEVISNTWTIYWEGGKQMKEQRGGGWKGFLSKLCKCWHHTCWSSYHGKHTERQFVFTPMKHWCLSYFIICLLREMTEQQWSFF